jgi:hypothetical protein
MAGSPQDRPNPETRARENLMPPRINNQDNGQMYSVLEILKPTDFGIQAQAQMSYYLHLPKEMSNVFSTDWQQKELGANVLSAMIAGNQGKGDNGSFSMNTLYGTAIDAAQGIGIGEGGLEAVRRSGGFAKNTVNTLLFQNSNLRNFQFTWDLMPTNSQYAKKYSSMIEELRLKMHPRLDSSTTYLTPYLFRLKIMVKGKYIMNTLPSALTNLTVNAFGTGVPAFHPDGSPVHTVLTLELQELVPQTQQSISSLYGDNTK